MILSFSQQRGANVTGLVKRFAPYVLDVRWMAGLAAALVLLTPLASIALLFLASVLIDEVLAAGDLALLPFIAAGYVALIATKLLLAYTSTVLDAAIVERVTHDVRSRLYRHVVSLSPGSLGKRGIGDILTHLSGDARRVEFLVFTGPLAVFADAAAALVFLVFLFAMSWKLTLCALLAVPLLVVVSLRLAPRVRRAARIARAEETAWMARAEERLGAAPIVQAFDAHAIEGDAFARRSDRARRSEVRTVAIQARLSLAVEALAALGGLLVIAVGAWEIRSGALTLGAFVAFLGAVGSLYAPARGLAKAPGRFQRAAAGAERVAHLLDSPSRVAECPTAKPLANVRGALEFRDVRFAYDSGPEILHGVSLTIEPGEMVALVGPSGGGKSTLARLALRLHDPASGSVLIDGVDLRDATLASLRRAVSVVFQDPYVFAGTALENIRYGRPGASDAEAAAMARAAHADAFIRRLPAGYGSPVGPRGGFLSGGQRQRIALARALLRDAPILILDEATAAVDSETEELIQDAVERLAGRRTILVVGHRLSSIRRADRIVVMEDGRIAETGTPQALLAGESRYRDLFAAQLGEAKLAA
jgi:ABC-type multidrug transport system fused ATPase/permease subunit